MEIITSKDGIMLDSDLLIALKARYGSNVFSDHEINNAFIALETQGLIHVQNISKNKRRIKMVQKEDLYMGVEED